MVGLEVRIRPRQSSIKYEKNDIQIALLVLFIVNGTIDVDADQKKLKLGPHLAIQTHPVFRYAHQMENDKSLGAWSSPFHTTPTVSLACVPNGKILPLQALWEKAERFHYSDFRSPRSPGWFDYTIIIFKHTRYTFSC